MWSPRLADLSTVPIPHATESLALARLCGLPRVMKRAMYELVRSPGYGQNDLDDSADDVDDEDGGVGMGMMGQRSGGGNRVELQSADKDALTRAREHLTSLWIATAKSVAKNFMHCPNAVSIDADPDAAAAAAAPENQNLAQPCTTTTPGLPLAHMRLVHESGLMDNFTFDAVCGLQALMDAPWAEEGFCAGCVELRRKSWQRTRVKTWENLGIWFGLGVDEGGGGGGGGGDDVGNGEESGEDSE